MDVEVHRLPGRPAVGAAGDGHLDVPDGVGSVRIDKDLAVVLRVAACVIAHPIPARAAVVRPEEAAVISLRHDEGVDTFGIPLVDAEGDAPLVDRGQPLFDTFPGCPGVGGLEDASLGATADGLPHGTPALVGSGINNIGVRRMKDRVGDAGVIGDVQDSSPALTAVRRLVETSVSAAVPQRPRGRYIHHIGVAWIDEDALDLLRVPQPNPLPGGAGIRRLVDTVTVGGAAIVGVFARAEPNDVRVSWIDDHAAEGIRRILVEDRCPGITAVHRLPQAPRPYRQVPDVVVARIDLQIGDPAGCQARADTTEFEPLENLGAELAVTLLGVRR